MYQNTPSDWNAYWTKCELCGQRYHRSDGGCDCTDDLDDCFCGENEWDYEYGELVCTQCGTTPGSVEDIEE